MSSRPMSFATEKLAFVRSSNGEREGGEFVEAPLSLLDNDRFRGEFPLADNALYEFVVAAWTDRFTTWREGFAKKVAAGRDVALDLREGVLFMRQALARAQGEAHAVLENAVVRLSADLTPEGAVELVDSAPLVSAMAELDPREDLVTSEPVLRIFAERKRAHFGNWYEFFPRSESEIPRWGPRCARPSEGCPSSLRWGSTSSTSRRCIPSEYPIARGRTTRDTPSRAIPAAPGPLATATEGTPPSTLCSGRSTTSTISSRRPATVGIEIALDFAIQCSPDHPWVKEHPDWFEHRADGSIRYAENPPNEYQDVCRIDFDTAGSRRALSPSSIA